MRLRHKSEWRCKSAKGFRRGTLRRNNKPWPKKILASLYSLLRTLRCVSCERIVDGILVHLQFLQLPKPLHLVLQLSQVRFLQGLARLNAQASWGQVVGVRMQHLSTEAATENPDGIEHEARSNLSQHLPLGLVHRIWRLRSYLVVSKPDFVVRVVEAHHVVVKGLALRVVPGGSPDLDEHRPHQLQEGDRAETFVE